MDRVPETRYVGVGDEDVAYQVIGEGPIDLVYFYGLGSHVDLLWEDDFSARFLRDLASFARLILFDRRGTGASGPLPTDGSPMWEAWVGDAVAVLDAAGSATAAICADLDAGPIAMLLSATRPERVAALVLSNTTARFSIADDYPIGLDSGSVDAIIEMIGSSWGSPELGSLMFPGRPPDALHIFARRLRACATPRQAAAQGRYILESLDVRAVLPLIQAATLVLHTAGNAFFPLEQGRYLADHIAGAGFVGVPGDGVSWDETNRERVIAEISAFVTGDQAPVEVDRVLTTVLFTDIADSTQRAAALGDLRWRTLLDAHDRVVRDQLRRFRGREIKTTGDGFFVSFDSPARAIRCAQAILAAVEPLDVDLRIGLHTGEVELRGEDVGGIAVHVAARVQGAAQAGEVLVSHTVTDLVAGSGITFVERGEHRLRGVPGGWHLFAVESA